MTVNQIYVFLIFIIDGILIGLLFDFFRILRKSFHTSNVTTYVEDIMFWILTGIIIMYTLYVVCGGEIRIYMFIGIFIGVCMYILTISKYIIKISVKIIMFLKKVTIFIFGPFISLTKFIHNNIKKLVLFVNKKRKKILDNNILQKNIKSIKEKYKKIEKKEGF